MTEVHACVRATDALGASPGRALCSIGAWRPQCLFAANTVRTGDAIRADTVVQARRATLGPAVVAQERVARLLDARRTNAGGGAARREHDLLDLTARGRADRSDWVRLTTPGAVAHPVAAAAGGALVDTRLMRVGARIRECAPPLATRFGARQASPLTSLGAAEPVSAEAARAVGVLRARRAGLQMGNEPDSAVTRRARWIAQIHAGRRQRPEDDQHPQVSLWDDKGPSTRAASRSRRRILVHRRRRNVSGFFARHTVKNGASRRTPRRGCLVAERWLRC
jgi:hypothetical protein